MISAATPKKCARFCHSTCFPSTSLQVGFVDERRRLQDVARPFACHLTRRHSMQLLLHERRKRVPCALISLTPGNQQAGDVRSCGRFHGPIGFVSRMLAL